MKIKGSCLCRSIKFSFDVEHNHFEACHCSMCRKWGGGPALTVEVKNNLIFEGEENISIFESSDWAERSFCSKCGSNLFYRLKDHSFVNFSLGLIDHHESMTFKKQIYIDHKPENYSFSNNTELMTEKEVLEQFGANDNG